MYAAATCCFIATEKLSQDASSEQLQAFSLSHADKKDEATAQEEEKEESKIVTVQRSLSEIQTLLDQVTESMLDKKPDFEAAIRTCLKAAESHSTTAATAVASTAAATVTTAVSSLVAERAERASLVAAVKELSEAFREAKTYTVHREPKLS